MRNQARREKQKRGKKVHVYDVDFFVPGESYRRIGLPYPPFTQIYTARKSTDTCKYHLVQSESVASLTEGLKTHEDRFMCTDQCPSSVTSPTRT